jgi:arylsulfatase A-like enzyme
MSDLGRKILCKEDISNAELNQLIELYDGGIKYVDHSIKCLLDDLKDLMLLEDTIIIITADHGDEFKEHGDFLHVETKLYDELIHIPLIIYNSGHCATINETVSHIDIAPTIMEMLNLPKVKTFKGNSLISILNGEERSGVISEGIGSQSIGSDLKLIISYRTKKWKYILNKMKDENELYNLEENPNEVENLKDVKKDIAESLNSIILEYILHQKKLVATDVKKEKMIGKIKKLKKGKKIS